MHFERGENVIINRAMGERHAGARCQVIRVDPGGIFFGSPKYSVLFEDGGVIEDLDGNDLFSPEREGR